MKLIASAASPFVRKCLVVLYETGLRNEVEIVQVATTPMQTPPEVITANPLGKIPALIRDDGPALYDSRVITRYFNARSGGTLYPEAQLWEVLTLEATADAIMDAAVLMTYEGRLRVKEQQSSEWLEAQWRKIDRALDTLESRWMSHLNGPLNIGQIATACALSYLDLRHDNRQWRSDRTPLADWQKAFAARESMQATKP